MTLLQFWQSLDSTAQGLILAIGILLLGTVKIKPLEINLWQWLAKTVGNALNHDLIEEVNQIKTQQDAIKKQFDEHELNDARQEALESRRRILRFAREILQGQRHTREDFIEILDQIDNYEKYCKEHPDFPNKRAVFASKSIQDNYQERLEKADFLAEEYRCRLIQKTSEQDKEK